MSELENKTGKRLQELREERKMSLRKFAEFIGVNKSTLFDWEKGNVGSLKTTSIKSICDKCNVSPLWIMGYEVPKEKETEEHRGLRNEISDSLLSMTMGQLQDIKKFIETFIIRGSKE